MVQVAVAASLAAFSQCIMIAMRAVVSGAEHLIHVTRLT